MSFKLPVLLVFTLLFSQILFQSCKTTSPCPDDPSYGNMGDVVNSKEDDLSPMASDSKLIFTSNRNNKRKEELFHSNLSGTDLLAAEEFEDLAFEKLKVSGAISVFTDADGNEEYYFSASTPGRNADKNIYLIKNLDGQWSKPTPLKSPVNTKFFDSYPCVSPDGKYLAFSSDRPGGNGQTDLYISKRSNGVWSAPVNMGIHVNSREEEISPFLKDDYTLYYSSKGFNLNSGFDIIKAKHNGGEIWNDAQLLRSPINTEVDEVGSTILDGGLIVSSNRYGGCGGFDLYKFDLCGPVLVEGSVLSDEGESGGIVQLLDKDKNLIEEKSVDEDNFYRFQLKANNNYFVKYVNPCFPNIDNSEEIFAICSDSTTVKLVLNFTESGSEDVFSFEKYGVPFYATGYYFPNTKDNLDALRMKFEYKFLGFADSTRYIENPGTKYDSFIETVEFALAEASDFILDRINYLNSHCSSGGEGLHIKVTGFSDPRPLSGTARYNGPQIHDPKFNMTIKPGDKMNNNELSSLRAYFTSKMIQNNLESNHIFKQFKDKISWEIDGSGIDDRNNVSDDMKRRIEIMVTVKN